MSNPVIPENSAQLFDSQIFNAQIPKEGPKAISLIIPFSTGMVFDINLLLTQSQQFMSMVQGVFCDNSKSPNDTLFTVSVLNYSLRCAPNNQLYAPLMVPKNAIISVASASGIDTRIILYNVPVPALSWPNLNSFTNDV